VRRAGKWLSLAAVLSLVFLLVWQVYKNRRTTTSQPS